MTTGTFTVASISWIDQASLPKVGFWLVAGALASWPKRVVMGLVGTSNPAPPLKLESLKVFAKARQYRAILSCKVEIGNRTRISAEMVDPGFTPPFDKAKIDTSLRSVAPIPDDPDFYPGEASPISGIVAERLHTCSSLSLRDGYKVVASALIKFRAGSHTDKMGIEKAASPVHVPWVWSEFAVVSFGRDHRLLCRGSVFPSHAWYVDGRQVHRQLQAQVSVSEHDPILSMGQPAEHLQTAASADKGSETIDKQAQAIAPGPQADVNLEL